jgi:hypothetical protein
LNFSIFIPATLGRLSSSTDRTGVKTVPAFRGWNGEKRS